MTSLEIRLRKKELRIERLKLEIFELENEIKAEKKISENVSNRRERNSGKQNA